MGSEFGLFWRYERKITVELLNRNHKKSRGNKLILLPVLGVAALASNVIIGAAPSSFAATASDTTIVTVNVGSVISIAADDIDINVSTPSPTGTFATGTGTVTVKTNDISGYSVYLTSNSETSTSLDHESVSSAKINSISATETISGSTTKFATNNTWAWSNDGTTFNPVVVKGTKNTASIPTLYRKTTAPTPAGDTSTLTVGATIDSSLTSGKYTGTLLLTAIPNGNTTEIANYDATV